MMRLPEIVLEAVSAAVGGVEVDNTATAPAKTVEATGFRKRRVVEEGTTLFDLCMQAAERLPRGALADVGAVVAATFTSPARFPSLAVRAASALSLGTDAPALDLQMACSAYPYALYTASRISADLSRPVLVLDGDVQSPFVADGDAATAPLFSDAATATVVRSDSRGASSFATLSRYSEALSCPAAGPISMDGFAVFSFVAAEVAPFLKEFAARAAADEPPLDGFVPHQANMYMVRQLAKSVGLSDILLTSGEEFANPGSSSIPLTLATRARPGRYLVAGFGAGLSASAATVRLAHGAAL